MFNAKSCLIFSTPSNISKVINEISQTENQHIQFVVAGTDSVIPNSNRNGVSVLWLDEPVNITGSKKLDEIPDDVMHKNWKLMESNLRLEAGKSSVFDLKLANTSFVGDLPITLFYIQPKHIELELENSGQALKELSLRLPKNVISNDSKVEEFDKWTALYDTADPFHVADFKGNLLKTINDKSAAGFLENNEKLMSIGSKDTEVYVKIYKKDSDLVYKYKVIAGGGGWGAKANIIALSPEAKINKGDRIEFYMLTPQHRFNEEQSLVAIEEYINKISIECAYEEQSYNDDTLGDELVIEKAFGAGSEEEFKYNDVKHHSSGERISIGI
ncbi:hypothetical protein DFJ63DRAFT_312268 [Scheffersomyces coipomensis]|uniref:uncharacterized protein n=1 Tax=Scheffersomyces coipomensis TaxID=1788519 RepID=UPI00315CED65